MAFKKTKWRAAYTALKERILDGTYPPGSEFATNKEIGEEFNLHSLTVHTAVNELIREGLVIPSEKRTMRRKVRAIAPLRSKRKGGFTVDSQSAEKCHKELVELKIITDQDDLPESVAETMQVPILFYHHNQFINDILVANSQSYIPGDVFPIEKLKDILSKEGARLYKSLEALGHKPLKVQEALIAGQATPEESKLLGLPGNSTITVARIDRKVFDANGHIVEFCKLTDRCDCYVFEYQFDLY